MTTLPIIVYPPDEQGGRRVRMDGEILGLAYTFRDIAEFLRRAGWMIRIRHGWRHRH